MSRLTASPFHKPSPFVFPPIQAPPSPPETHSDTIALGPQTGPPLHPFGSQDYILNEASLATGSPDTSGSRFKRGSSLPYHSSGIRDNKDRATPRSAKALVIIIPPSPLVQDYSRLGHASHIGASNRLSQGVVMPLFPTLFAQLSAIAKEFNFPSTTGLCLYFHHVEDGITITPRISDDSWQAIWAHLSDPTPSSGRRLISGKMEFDVDLRLARWYSSWASAVHRENTEPFSYHPSTAPSLAHFRADSRTTMADGRPLFEEDGNESVLKQHHSAPVSRHVPRKLSLVERFDTSAQPDLRACVLSASPQDIPSTGSHVLTTIMQEDEPKTAKQDLNNRVKSWRASALTAPSPLAASGQTSLDPSNLPNNVEIATSSTPVSEEEFRLEDFAWSATSAGPLSYGEISPVSWSRVSSVDLAHRVEGSMCSTLSYHTSNGPLSSGEISPVSWSAVASVHLADRLEGSVCSTESYRTSFGPSEYNPLSPTWYSGYPTIPTPDIARRFIESIPSTPGTATTWGAPLSYPPSPRCASPTLSVDLCGRLRLDDLEPPLPHYPRPVLEDSPLPLAEDKALAQKIIDVWSEKPWSHVWPYNQKSQATTTSRSAGWAKIEVARVLEKAGPAAQGETEEEQSDSTTMSPKARTQAQMVLDTWNDRPWSHVWPYNKSRTESATARQPALKASSTWNKVKASDVISKAVVFKPEQAYSAFGYPFLRIYEPAYPHFDLYPSLPGTIKAFHSSEDTETRPSFCTIHVPSVYPAFDLYPAVYPYNLTNIYPSVARSAELVEVQAAYPYFNIYAAVRSPYNAYLSLYLSTPRSQYPVFELYPTAALHGQKGDASPLVTEQSSQSQSVHLHVYPALNIYPTVYPFFDLYPAAAPPPSKGVSAVSVDHPLSSTACLKVAIVPAYPSFNLYPSVYPYLDIYPAPYFSSEGSRLVVESRQSTSVSKTAQHQFVPASIAHYPYFNIYPAVYPNFDLYPSKLETPVPPAPCSVPTAPDLQINRKTRSNSRLTHSELHAMVMMERISSRGSFDHADPQPRLQLRRQNSSLPTLPSSNLNDAGHSSRLDGIRRSLSLSSSNQSGDVRRPEVLKFAGTGSRRNKTIVYAHNDKHNDKQTLGLAQTRQPSVAESKGL
ncbi:hypothetical protein NLJ89_g1963 [Agrocybe chaxingu]|uniref:Uncharacterized protein n=1 Tax=Agrocybe chaxingu TaxID=84603 RepID=A0A9W8TDF2_9AGAR|nr:hypothetical protein NLJ89_g1963 [Agrocybe chaxingu]